MRRLAGVLELLDGPLDDPAALRGNLRDLARVNRRLGGTEASRRALDHLLDHRHGAQTMLDVGTGAADIPVALVDAAASTGRELRVTAVDSRQEVLDAARAVNGRLAAMPGVELVLGDGRSLPWPDRSFDVVHASLVIHHLEPREAVAFLTEASRLARRGVVVNDLVRARHHWIGAKVLLTLATRNRYTRYDGPLSVRRAYTRVELRALLAAAGLRPLAEIAAHRGPPGRHRRGADPPAGRVSDPAPGRAAAGRRARRPAPRPGRSTSRSSGAVRRAPRSAARLARAGPHGRAARAEPGLALAGGRRVRLAGRGRGAARARPCRRRRSRRSPGRSPRCAWRRRPGPRSS